MPNSSSSNKDSDRRYSSRRKSSDDEYYSSKSSSHQTSSAYGNSGEFSSSKDKKSLSSNMSYSSSASATDIKVPLKTCGDWSEFMSSAGKVYYYNSRTERTQWEKPPDWDWMLMQQEKFAKNDYRDYMYSNSKSRYSRSKYENETSRHYADSKAYHRDYANDYMNPMMNSQQSSSSSPYNRSYTHSMSEQQSGSPMINNTPNPQQHSSQLQQSTSMPAGSNSNNYYYDQSMSNDYYYRQNYMNTTSTSSKYKEDVGYNNKMSPMSYDDMKSPYSSSSYHHSNHHHHRHGSRYDTYDSNSRYSSEASSSYRNQPGGFSSSGYGQSPVPTSANASNTTPTPSASSQPLASSSSSYHQHYNQSPYSQSGSMNPLPNNSSTNSTNYENDYRYNSRASRVNQDYPDYDYGYHHGSSSHHHYHHHYSNHYQQRSYSRTSSRSNSSEDSNSYNNRYSNKRAKKNYESTSNTNSLTPSNNASSTINGSNGAPQTGGVLQSSPRVNEQHNYDKSNESNKHVNMNLNSNNADMKSANEIKREDMESQENLKEMIKVEDYPPNEIKPYSKEREKENTYSKSSSKQNEQPSNSLVFQLSSTGDDIAKYYKPDLAARLHNALGVTENFAWITQYYTKQIDYAKQAVELKKNRSLVRIHEIKKTLQEQRLVSLQTQMKEIEELLN